ncbi:RNA polymerase sigma factor [Roseiconus lacunae]|uniref:RNA polymerase sigma factor n=1 Tax=Roseiconus lacunae TaxID=2605694 RepID=UPI001E334F2D|nr:sigma-70 family RNA polymerase sigma factor [Roseiconus lacunae]MCD0460490.1 sigma-70 family RNA polymerase sigma factor [Roseiconus lacunae]
MNQSTPSIEFQPTLAAAIKKADLTASSDADLLDAWSRDKLSEAFTELVSRYSVMVLSVCRRKCRCPADAEDAYQTTFLLLAKNGHKIRRPECLPGWLHRVAQRASMATLQRSIELQQSTEQLECSGALSVSDDPLDQIAAQHDAVILDEELAALPDRYRTVLVMQVYQGLRLETMAERFQTSVGTIRGRLQRGRKLLAGRLRRRGVVPLLAFTSAVTTSVGSAEASLASSQFLHAFGSAKSIPHPPIPESLVNPLLSTGKRLMSPWNLAGGAAAAGTLTLLLLTPIDGLVDAASGDDPEITVANNQATSTELVRTETIAVTPASESSPATTAQADMPNPDTDRNGSPASEVAKRVQSELDRFGDLTVDSTVGDLASTLQEQLSLPVIMDVRAFDFAQLDRDRTVKYEANEEPVRTVLRKILDPLGLKAVVQNEGLVITANPSQLVHRGIGTDLWLNADNDSMLELANKISQQTSQSFIDTPLEDAIRVFENETEISFQIDRRALEEIGLDAELGVTFAVNSVPVYDSMKSMLRDFDLVLTVFNNIPTVTTVEAAESKLLNRVYWLEGLGLNGHYDSLMQMIQTTVTPDCWEALGGNSTMAPGPGDRPCIVISSTYEVHREIEELIKAFRANSFASQESDVPMKYEPPQMPAGLGGGGFGGGGGGFF